MRENIRRSGRPVDSRASTICLERESNSRWRSNNRCSLGENGDSVEEGSLTSPRGCDVDDRIIDTDNSRSVSRDILCLHGPVRTDCQDRNVDQRNWLVNCARKFLPQLGYTNSGQNSAKTADWLTARIRRVRRRRRIHCSGYLYCTEPGRELEQKIKLTLINNCATISEPKIRSDMTHPWISPLLEAALTQKGRFCRLKSRS